MKKFRTELTQQARAELGKKFQETGILACEVIVQSPVRRWQAQLSCGLKSFKDSAKNVLHTCLNTYLVPTYF